MPQSTDFMGIFQECVTICKILISSYYEEIKKHFSVGVSLEKLAYLISKYGNKENIETKYF